MIRVKNRDAVIESLKDKRIYLPVHWKNPQSKNKLFKDLISIPMFSNYSDEAFNYMVKQLQNILEIKNEK